MSATAALSPTHTFLSQLLEAQSLALEKLVSLLKSSKLEREIRLAALAILRFKPSVAPAFQPVSSPSSAAAPAFQPASSPPSSTHSLPTSPPGRSPVPLAPTTPFPLSPPLSPQELSALHALLPQVKPERFLKKHTPAHWREVIERNAERGRR